MATDWVCPHCDRAQTVGVNDRRSEHHHIYLDDLAEGNVGLNVTATRCANAKCNRLTLFARVGRDQTQIGTNWHPTVGPKALFSGYLVPRGAAKPQPECIPAAIREDYSEACLIRDLSPKASATLSRRCIQGMIRDFCSISKGRLIDEIAALKHAVVNGTAPPGVTSESVDAIDHIRAIGNIGAHMEKDVNTIIPVDPGEAEALTDLIEMLFREWYIERQARKERLARITAIGTEKKAMKAPAAAAGSDDTAAAPPEEAA